MLWLLNSVIVYQYVLYLKYERSHTTVTVIVKNCDYERNHILFMYILVFLRRFDLLIFEFELTCTLILYIKFNHSHNAFSPGTLIYAYNYAPNHQSKYNLPYITSRP